MKPYYGPHAGITIYYGDCLEVLPLVEADVMVTDPPYGMAYQGWNNQANVVVNDASTEVRDEALAIWGNRPALVFGKWSIARPQAARMLLIWDKGDWPGMGDLSLPWGPSTEEIYVLGSGFVGSRSGQIIKDARRPNEHSAHPTVKPLRLMLQLVERCPLGTIVDPFMGSGTTLEAAKRLGRRSIGIEIEERYCEIAAKRLDQEVLQFQEGELRGQPEEQLGIWEEGLRGVAG